MKNGERKYGELVVRPEKPGVGAGSPAARPRKEDLAARAQSEGAKVDSALLQFLRELLWDRLMETGDPETAVRILPVIIAARRQTLAESNPAGRQERQEFMTPEEEHDALGAYFGKSAVTNSGRPSGRPPGI